ncbi:MAG: DNA modification methylase, partial [Novosphingobium sp.]
NAACRQVELHGIVEPPLIDADNTVVCGSVIVRAAQKLKLEAIPVLRVSNMSPEELRLYAINAHKLTDMGAYDEALFVEELRELEKLLGAGSLDHLAIAEGELIRLLGLTEAQLPDDSVMRVDDTGTPITRLGDLWQMGPHRLLCGTALEAASFALLMGEEKAQFGLTDSPYNLGAATISGVAGREEFAFAHGEMSPHEFTRFLCEPMRHMKMWSEPGALHAWFMSYHFLLELMRAGNIVFGRPRAMCTWVKSQGGQGGLFRSQTEHIVYFRNGDVPHRNNVMLGKHGRNRTTAWQYEGMNTASAERDALLALHATPKPVLMLKDAILDVTTRGGIVLDPFAGVGSIALAAQSAERRAFCIEIEPRYVDAAIRRMQAAFGIDAIRASDGASFAALEAARIREAA